MRRCKSIRIVRTVIRPVRVRIHIRRTGRTTRVIRSHTRRLPCR